LGNSGKTTKFEAGTVAPRWGYGLRRDGNLLAVRCESMESPGEMSSLSFFRLTLRRLRYYKKGSARPKTSNNETSQKSGLGIGLFYSRRGERFRDYLASRPKLGLDSPISPVPTCARASCCLTLPPNTCLPHRISPSSISCVCVCVSRGFKSPALASHLYRVLRRGDEW